MNQKNEYNLEDLIELLENIKEEGDGSINFAKALYCLCKEIEKINFYVEFLDACIPRKYKKLFPKDGESPFFDDLGLTLPPDPKEYDEARKRMKAWAEKSKQDSSEASQDL